MGRTLSAIISAQITAAWFTAAPTISVDYALVTCANTQPPTTLLIAMPANTKGVTLAALKTARLTVAGLFITALVTFVGFATAIFTLDIPLTVKFIAAPANSVGYALAPCTFTKIPTA